jgi:alpha-tubulin suppressor-like RCC1 family protein
MTGRSHTCALVDNSGVRCWGKNDGGQLGNGTRDNSRWPENQDVLSGAKALAAGGSHTCALTQAGGVRCWGDNTAGQLGNSTSTALLNPPNTDVLTGVKAIASDPALTGVQSTALGEGHGCAVRASGGVRCWGDNSAGQLGNPDVLTRVRAIWTSGVSAHTCSQMASGEIRCWGKNDSGQFGNGTTLDVGAPVPISVGAEVQAIAT